MNSQFIIDWFILSNFCIFTKDRHQRCDRANAQKISFVLLYYMAAEAK